MTTPAQRRAADAHRASAIAEATSSLAAGITLIASEGWSPAAGQSSLQLVSSGVERLAKLTIGLMVEAEEGAFPNQKTLKGYGHHVEKLLRALAARIRTQATREGRGYVLGLLDALEADPYWPDLIKALDLAAAAKGGRYVHLSALGGTQLEGAGVQEIWQGLDDRAAVELGVLGELSGPASRAVLMRVRRRILLPLVRWWSLVVRVWQHGLAGPVARRSSTEVRLEWSALPEELGTFARSL